MTVYLDPPYYNKGSALYTEFMQPAEHIKMADVLQKSAVTKWILSYDDCTQVRELYSKNTIIDLAARYCINGKKTSWEKKSELIITP